MRKRVDSLIFYTMLLLLLSSLTFIAILNKENTNLLDSYESALQSNYEAHRRMDDIKVRQRQIIKFCKDRYMRRNFVIRKMRIQDVRF